MHSSSSNAKSSEVSIKTRSTPASLTIQSQVTKDTKWSILEKTAKRIFMLTVLNRQENTVNLSQSPSPIEDL